MQLTDGQEESSQVRLPVHGMPSEGSGAGGQWGFWVCVGGKLAVKGVCPLSWERRKRQDRMGRQPQCPEYGDFGSSAQFLNCTQVLKYKKYCLQVLMKQSHGSVAYVNLYMCDLVFINLFWASELMCEIGSARIVIPFHPALYVQTPRFLQNWTR